MKKNSIEESIKRIKKLIIWEQNVMYPEVDNFDKNNELGTVPNFDEKDEWDVQIEDLISQSERLLNQYKDMYDKMGDSPTREFIKSEIVHHMDALEKLKFTINRI